MSLFEDTNPRELKELLGQIHRCESALPEFQRDFVWEPRATQELIVSIANNYPAGSLLRIRNTHNLFAHREFQGAPALNDNQATFLVLDGQQRQTSLYQAFYGVGEHRYFIRIDRLIGGQDFEDAIFHLRANIRRARRLESIEVQAKDLIMPLSVLKEGFGGYLRWVMEVVQRRESKSAEQMDLQQKMVEVGEACIQTIDDYRFPVVTLSDDTQADAVCTIFETLNRTGVKLSPFELLTARFWAQDVNLRDLWAAARDRHPEIEDFDIDPYYVLQGISLMARKAPGCKRSEVLALTAADIEGHWWPAIAGLAEALRLLKEECGVLLPRWLPYQTIVIPLLAIMARSLEATGPKAGAQREKLLRWFWCAVFGQAYENSPNSQAAKDYAEVLNWFEREEEPECVRGFRFDPRLLRDTTPRQRALYRGTICLILRNGARDFHEQRPITGIMIADNHIDDHHIFPDSFLKTSNVSTTQRLRDCVLNRTLIDRSTNQRIGKRAPSDYLQEISVTAGADSLGKILTSHLVDAGTEAPIWRDDYQSFLDQRQEAIWSIIKEITGAQEAASLLEAAE